ncbi:E3 ubiquitin-protein ligase RGLG4-like [Phragmites australis]|uniref:E3 ubiquitin-protein ligase RGLG4-like n=1 Tax=Phragmites australis TaxID=29695 RepID=UPI002D775369|nr:E3 ubiquitin-protein ligase RGLG4-like [Phragmites australis]XP_062196650.1 E3 ubiquitin-protein ligase RGLG4-like [Phragmites australis]
MMGGVFGALFGGGHRRAVGRPAPATRHQGMGRQPLAHDAGGGHRRAVLAKKYSYIPDTYTSLEQVSAALREQGLESSNLILGIDFTKSNEWTGKRSFGGQSLHRLGDTPNPYEQAISIIGKTLAPFDEDNLIPCFGFGDATTHDCNVFSFHPDNSPCHGFEEVLACYRKIVPHLRLSGPTSFAPIVEAAVDIVDRSGGQYHVLVIVADGQVTRSVETSDGDLSPQERRTVDSIVMASSYPLSIVLVGVGDGPWEDMQKFDDKLPARDFDNFQFVNFTSIMARDTMAQQKESAFALAALMEVPIQYKATVELGILGRSTGTAKRVAPAPPPLPPQQRQPSLRRRASNVNEAAAQPAAPRDDQVCPICLTNTKDLAFGCGHMCCRECGENLTKCPICRQSIRSRLRLYSG